MPASTELLRTRTFTVLDHRCDEPRGGCGCCTAEDTSHVTLVRRGCFKAHVNQREWLVSPASAFVYRAGTEFRTSHPVDGGDDCTIITLAPELLEEIFGAQMASSRLTELRATTRMVEVHARTFSTLQRIADRLHREETALDLLRETGRQPGSDGRRSAAAAAARRLVMRTREMIHADLSSNLSIDDLAATCGSSPFHLMRLFRRETGTTIRAYRRDVRIAEATHRIASGSEPLSGIAYDCGFASHSHMTDAITSALGVAPRTLRSLG